MLADLMGATGDAGEMMGRRVLLGGGLALLACPPALAAPYRDMTGREVAVALPASRIVCLVPSVTELIYALGAEARLVGRTDFCDDPPAVRARPSVGGMVAPNLESIVALRADLVIGTTEGSREETFAQLRRLGVAVYLVRVHRVADALDLVARVGLLAGRGAAVGPLVDHMKAEVARVQARVKRFRAPRVLYVLWPEPLIVPARDALVSELIGLAGGRSVTDVPGDAYPRFSLEAAVAAAPEVIILASHGSRSGAVEREKWERLAALPAIRSGRLHTVSGDLLHRYGPRMIDGLDQLARAIHPEAFR